MKILLVTVVLLGLGTIIARYFFLQRRLKEEEDSQRKRHDLRKKAQGFPGMTAHGALQAAGVTQRRKPQDALDQLLAVTEGATLVPDHEVVPSQKAEVSGHAWAEEVGRSNVQRI